MKKKQKNLYYKDFIQRENAPLHSPYHPESELYHAIRSGDEKTVRKLNNQPLFEKQGFGTLSLNPVHNLRYYLVITAVQAASHCVEGGMELSHAYAISNYYIQKADTYSSTDELAKLYSIMCLDYVRRMKNIAKNKIVSLHISNCLDYIYDNLHTRITINTLSNHVNLSPSYLSRLFKKEVGVSVSEYILHKKIEAAKNMLASSNYTASQIAFTLAFPNQSYFTEIFKKKTGLTPRQYRSENFMKQR